VRLIGAGAGSLSGPDGRQLALFAEGEEKQHQLDAALDSLRARFGPGAVRRRGPDRDSF
jgi:hypothetical protein